ncbi:MAG: Rha family transcriptional regulator [Fusobacteriaceae bacterium]
MKLVEVKQGKVFTTSLIFAEQFGLEHKHILEKIRNLTVEYSTIKNEFVETEFTNARNRKYPMFLMTRKAFMFLVMNTGAKEQNMQRVWDMQYKIIEAFDYMEKQLTIQLHNSKNEEWLQMRNVVIENRKEETSVIKDFVDYATNQGSKNAKNYYMLITKETNKNLCFIQHKVPKIRETLDTLQLGQLIMLENVIGKSLVKYMEEGTHYKEIYKKVVKDMKQLCELFGVKTIS